MHSQTTHFKNGTQITSHTIETALWFFSLLGNVEKNAVVIFMLAKNREFLQQKGFE